MESQALELAVTADPNSAAGLDHGLGKLGMFRKDVFFGYDPSGEARVVSPPARPGVELGVGKKSHQLGVVYHPLGGVVVVLGPGAPVGHQEGWGIGRATADK